MPHNKPFYITTTLPYVNADPHVGFAMEIIRADAVARYKTLRGYDVFFNTGTDEHGMKMERAARDAGKTPQAYVDAYAERFRGLIDLLGISPDVHFIRTTDEHHMHAAQAFWKLCADNGYIYKKEYEAKYCVGCELEKTDSELVDGRCPEHPNKDIEIIKEENYFFKFSAFQEKLLALYEARPDFVRPDVRFNNIKKFVEGGLQDFSISRLKEKMSWGIPVPGDDAHVMYVWFDALVNYVSTLGWPEDTETFYRYWGEGNPVQYAGKDNLRQQSAIWQAMLMAAGLPNTYTVVIDGFITGGGGVKMSKSLGNVVNPYDVVSAYGTDALRYFLLRHVHPFEDSDFTMERFADDYTAHLVNGLGNLTNRILKMSETYVDEPVPVIKKRLEDFPTYCESADMFEWHKVADSVWEKVGAADARIQESEPFKLVKTDPEKAKKIVVELVQELSDIAVLLAPLLPETARKIEEGIAKNKKPELPLFARK
ncbi:MAG: methionine--tRNA ligase [Candidatus Yonathbacteria bacterium]|nr:methionine--tRNA ligase [Candidatus Yonathbacteria bacterium]NTW48074.1 methionine--tRNA ligase [Candidatus Yonathbacteria bacterium]